MKYCVSRICLLVFFVCSFILGICVLTVTSNAAPGDLDTTFISGIGGGTGINIPNVVTASAVQPDGKILIAGSFITYDGIARGRVARLNNDGTLDYSFLTVGVGANSSIFDLQLESSGKILIAGDFTSYNGTARGYIARLNSDGSLDTTTFTTTGANNSIAHFDLDSNGKIIITGDFTLYNAVAFGRIVRLNSDGSIDLSFSNSGSGFDNRTNALAIQSDNKVIVSGDFINYNGSAAPNLSRINIDGSLDNTFSCLLPSNPPEAVAIQNDGKVLVGGAFTSFNGSSRRHIVRLNSDCSTDNSFADIFVSNPIGGVMDILIQPDNKILISRTAAKGVTRANIDGSIDTVSVLPSSTSSVFNMELQTDGKVFIGGDFTTINSINRGGVARLNTNLTLDTYFLNTAVSIKAIALQSDGKLLIAGDLTSYSGVAIGNVVRVNTDGSLDSSFLTYTGITDGIIYALAVQGDGKIIVAGNFSNYDGVARDSLARLNSDGTLDLTFVNNSGTNNSILTLALQSDGKIIIGGIFTTFNSTTRNRLARVNTDGTLDTAFLNSGVAASALVSSIAVQSDGKIIIGGSFVSYNGTSRLRIARVNSDGTLDNIFSSSGADGPVNSVVIDSVGKVLIGGSFIQYDALNKLNVARALANGSVDTNFLVFAGPEAGADDSVNALVLRTNGKILIAGDFNNYTTIARGKLAQLNTDGSLDTSFLNTGSGANNSIAVMAMQPDGKVFIGGAFTSYSSQGVNHLARIANLPASLPSISSVSLNSGLAINLTAGTTTAISATATVTNTDGYASIGTVSAKIYRSGVGDSCSIDNNNCYAVSCALSACAGISCTATCTANIEYYAEPTLSGTYAAENWVATLTAAAAPASPASSSGVELNNLISFTLNPSGTLVFPLLEPNDDTGAVNETMTIFNNGNETFNTMLSGSDLCSDYPTCSGALVKIPIANTKYATSTFTYSIGGISLTTTPTSLIINLAKTTSQILYLGQAVPSVAPAELYTGSLTITAY